MKSLGDEYFIVNDSDQDLRPIKVHIPSLIIKNYLFWSPNATEAELNAILNPPLNKIRNHNKKREKQYWTKELLPEKLVKLEKIHGGDQKKKRSGARRSAAAHTGATGS